MTRNSDQKFLRLFRESLRSEEGPELTDEVVDALLELPSSMSADAVESMRARFVRKVFSELHPEPVKVIPRKRPFGLWIEAIRKSANLSRTEVAAALGKDEPFLERIESGDAPPWTFSADDIASIVQLFRLHIDAVVQLIQNTVAGNKGRIADPVSARTRGRHTPEAKRLPGRTTGDRRRDHNDNPIELDQTINSWIAELRSGLERRDAIDLLR
jgi:transcriptional regulator with XRE-family HTH domain